MPSIFRDHATAETRISFLFLEILGNLIEETKNISIEDAIKKAYETSWQRKLASKEVAAIALKLKQKDDEISKRTEESETPLLSKHMGTEELQWVSKLNPVELCLYVTDFDFEKAHHLYCKCDFNVVTEMLRLRQDYRWKKIVTGFEQSMYGFGGGYDKTSKDNENLPKLERDADGSISQSSIANLNKLGF